MHEHCSQVLAAAAARGKELGLPYAGAVMPAEAWELVKALQATLLDVRTMRSGSLSERLPSPSALNGACGPVWRSILISPAKLWHKYQLTARWCCCAAAGYVPMLPQSVWPDTDTLRSTSLRDLKATAMPLASAGNLAAGVGTACRGVRDRLFFLRSESLRQ